MGTGDFSAGAYQRASLEPILQGHTDNICCTDNISRFTIYYTSLLIGCKTENNKKTENNNNKKKILSFSLGIFKSFYVQLQMLDLLHISVLKLSKGQVVGKGF